ncbi:CMRF35-like molecule 8 isoform X2 [Conger conger]|uniref:CMRF35-like molecule 8 isoform X2 n=1 Tax=Conger conger TaxID=82655 RepID=UPI002A5B0009|nr:CMRF35-like molecule 8 isoform X2 [Conger conger]
MNSLATFTLFLSACGSVGAAAVSAPREVSGAVGQTVTVHCGYERRYARRAKYWCRGKPYESCREVVRTGGPAERDRTSITDDRNARVFSVTISSLQPHDPDSYWCVVSLPFRNVFAPVRLYVHQPTVPPFTTTATKGPEDCRAPHSDAWATLRWVLFFLMLACPLGVCAWERRAGRCCGSPCPRTCVPSCPSRLPPFPRTG